MGISEVVMERKIKIGVSSCLLGEKVSWNGENYQV